VSGPAQTLAAELDFLRFDEIVGLAETAVFYWRSLGLAAERREPSRNRPRTSDLKEFDHGFTPASIPAFARAGKKKRALQM
jgi:hypothetical protein